MDHEYRIDGVGEPDALLDASAAADAALAERSGTVTTSRFVGGMTYVFALGGAAAVAMITVYPLLSESESISDPAAVFGSIFLGVVVLSLALNVINRALTRRFAEAYCEEPMFEGCQYELSSKGFVVRSAVSETRFDWRGVTHIEATPKAILIMSGFAWGYVPISGFETVEQAKAALDDMRRWSQQAQTQ